MAMPEKAKKAGRLLAKVPTISAREHGGHKPTSNYCQDCELTSTQAVPSSTHEHAQLSQGSTIARIATFLICSKIKAGFPVPLIIN
jgi:hypothetical protein